MTQAPVFIGGFNRSGTTLMSQLLAAHPDLAIPPTELQFFDAFPKASRGLSTGEMESVVEQLLRGPRASHWGLEVDDVIRFAMDEGASLRGVFVGLLRAYAARLGKPRFGEKSTGYEHRLSTLDGWFPDGYRFVQMIRHPLLAYASLCMYHGTLEWVDPTDWSGGWLRSLAIGLDRQAGARDAYAVVRYEDLVRDPVGELARICPVVQVEYDARMLEIPGVSGGEGTSFELTGAEYAGKIRVADDVDRVAAVPDRQLSVVRRLCRDAARIAGYDVDDETAVTPVNWPDGIPRLVRRAVRVHSLSALASRSRRRLSFRA